MAKQNNNTKQGFTIIEVVLVLAIAGLIFLMVFVALPALQRSQRDTARRNDMSRVDTSLVQYQTNHSNTSDNLPVVPSGVNSVSWQGDSQFTNCDNVACAFVRDYMNSGSAENDGKANTFEDPDGTPYSMVITCNWSSNRCDPTGAGISTSQLAEATAQTGETGVTIGNQGDGQAYDAHAIYIIPGGRCVGDVVVNSTKRHFAVLYRLEGAGTYCIDDQ